jgi:phage baseplate assembly protein W
MANRFINIQFPFKDSESGFLVALTKEDNAAIKSDLMHLLLTRRGERLYMPKFGTNLLKFIFEPNDGITHSEIETEIKDTVKLYIPNLTITSLTIENDPDKNWVAIVNIEFTLTDGVFISKDFITIQI